MRVDAYTCAVLSAAVYEAPQAEEFVSRQVGYYPETRLDRHDTQATLYLPRNEEAAGTPVLAFRGTEFMKSWTDLLRNMGWRVNWAGPGQAHRGYLRGYNMIRDDVLDVSRRYPELVLTGHSLGGATATLAAAHLSSRAGMPFNSRLVTFGAPPCLDAEAMSRLRPERYVVENDFAPHIPGWLVGLSHGLSRPIRLSRYGWSPLSIRAHGLPIYLDRLERRLFVTGQLGYGAPQITPDTMENR